MNIPCVMRTYIFLYTRFWVSKRVPLSLTSKTSAFCTHVVYLCVTHDSHNKNTIVSVHNIRRWVFLVDAQFVVCEVKLSPYVCLLSAVLQAVAWLKVLVAGLSSRRPGFDPLSVHVSYIVNEVHWDRFSSSTWGFLCIIPPVLRTNIQLHVSLTRRTTRQNLRTFQKAAIFRKAGSTGQKNTCA
jgi:hypothetical protein